MKRLIVLLLGALAFLVPVAPSYAQTVFAKTVTACGTPGNTPVVGNPYPVTQDTTGALCTNATITSTGVAGFTSVATPTAVAAGTNKPANIDAANGALMVTQVKPGTTTTIDLSAPGGVLGVDGSTIATAINPFPVSTGATASVAISTTAAGGPTQLIAAVSTKKIYVYHYSLIVSGAGTFAWITGTGTNCGTGTAYMTGSSGHPMSFAANGGISAGGGGGPILITGASGELCYITTGSVDISGSVAYAQF